MGEEPLEEVAVRGVGAVGLDVDADAVVRGPGQALAVVVAGDAEDLVVAQPRSLERSVGRVDVGAADLGREPDGLLDVGDAEAGPIMG